MIGLLFVLAVLVGAAAAVGLVALAVSSKRSADRSNEIIPGTPSLAPDSWAGAHTPEAKLHRRLVDVVAALRAVHGLDGMTLDRRADIERHALELDRRLVAVAALPAGVRTEPLGIIEGDVKELEMGVAALTVRVAEQRLPLDDAFRDLAERLDHLDQARSELDAVTPGPAPSVDVAPAPVSAPPVPDAAPAFQAESSPPEPSSASDPPQSDPPQTAPPA